MKAVSTGGGMRPIIEIKDHDFAQQLLISHSYSYWMRYPHPPGTHGFQYTEEQNGGNSKWKAAGRIEPAAYTVSVAQVSCATWRNCHRPVVIAQRLTTGFKNY
jgi:hypothetical protein